MIIHYEKSSKRRFYTFYVTKDLFGYWTLAKHWGSLDSRLGGHEKQAFFSYKACKRKLNELKKIRLNRGYQKVIQ